MIVSLLLIAALAFGGLALSYLFAEDEPFMCRLAAGCVIGSAIGGTAAFLFALAGGMNAGVSIAAIILALAPLALFSDKRRRSNLKRDWAKAKGKLQGANLPKILTFCFYAFWLLLFIVFFGRAMMITPQGIFTGGSQNLGDLPFHLGAIFSFTDGDNFPPQNPSFAGAKFAYPFVTDILTAAFIKLGTDVRSAILVQNVAWAFSLLVILERFVVRLTGSRAAGRFAPFILFFSGGLGFFAFFGDYWGQAKGFFEFLSNLPADYTIGSDKLRWGNSLVVLFITQRSLLLGMPLTLLIAGELWSRFRSGTADKERTNVSLIVVGLIAGMLPLVHLHSLFVLFVIGIFLFVLKTADWKQWATFAAATAVIAVPELLWSLSGSASETSKFVGWHFGWSKGDQNFVWFWLVNTGLLIPLVLLGAWLVYSKSAAVGEEYVKSGKSAKAIDALGRLPDGRELVLFYLPFAFLFLLCNAIRLAPWEWDNIKVLIYWFVGSIPFVAIALAWVWQKGRKGTLIALACLVVLTLSGALDVWRTASGQINYKVFDKDAVQVAEAIKARTDPHSLFLNAPTYNPATALSGRISLMRYTGHLFSHGIDYAEREADVKRIYQGGPAADELLAKYGIDYVLVSPEERQSLSANEDYFRKFPVIAEAGQYRVYKVK